MWGCISMRRIMIWGWFGFENLGDDLLLRTMLSFLDKKENVITVPMKKTYKQTININQIYRNYKNLVFGVSNNDVLIIGPGGLFPFDNKLKVALYLIITMIWKLMNRKVVFFGIGISEKMSGISAFLWRNIVVHTDLFITRNPNFFKKIKIEESNKNHSMSDTVFSLKYKFKRQTNNSVIGISVANLKNEIDSTFQRSVDVWTDVIKKLLIDGYEVELLAFTKGQDDTMIDSIKTHFKENNNVKTIHYEDMEGKILKWGKYRAVICMRFHSLVLSIKAFVPALPIAYGHKTYTLAKECGLEEYTLKWNNSQSAYYGKNVELSASEIINKLALVISDEQKIENLMMLNCKNFDTSSSRAFDKLNDVINTEEAK